MPSTFEIAYNQLNNAQKDAVDQIDGPVLVIAGPGTGKTQLLSVRIANILARTDTLPENILCLTFTDSAAATMRERLTNIIGQASYGITVSTYHAFGSDVMRRNPDYFIAESDMQSTDDLAIDSAFRDVIEQLPYSNPLKPDVFLRDIKELISDAKRALMTPDDLRTMAEHNELFYRQMQTLLKPLTVQLSRVSKSSVQSFHALLTSSPVFKKSDTSFVPLQTLWNDSLSLALETVTQSGKTVALSVWKKQWLEKDADGDFIPIGKRQAPKLRALAIIFERYDELLATQNLYDYDDMILRAITGIEQNPELRFSLQEQYQYILLDEYQDTNAAQSRIVELLTDNPIYEDQPNIMAVGDDDQAIYAFQGANYSHMLQFIARYRDVHVVSLTENYRSHPDIIALSAAIGRQIGTRLDRQLPAINKNLVSANTKLPKQAIIERHEFKSALGQNAWVAEHIAMAIKNGLAAREIAVISPKHEFLEDLVPYLRTSNIPIHYDKREDVLATPLIQRLIEMSQLIMALHSDAPSLNMLWSRVLSYEAWSIPTSVILKLSWQVRDSHTSWLEEILKRTETRWIGLFFIRLSQIVDTEPLEQMLDWLIGIQPLKLQESDLAAVTSPIYEAFFGLLSPDMDHAGTYWQLVSDLTVLRQRLRHYVPNQRTALLLPDFVSFVQSHLRANINIINSNPYQESANAVELLTAYRAKGQEYKVVFLVSLQDEVWGSRSAHRHNLITLPKNLDYIRYAGADEDERMRLLYVALTRAKTELYLVNFSSSFTGKSTNRLKYLDESISSDGTVMSPHLPAASRQVLQEDDTVLPTLQTLEQQWNARYLNDLHAAPMRDLLQPKLASYQLSPTDFNTYLDVTHDGPTKFFVRSLLCFPYALTPGMQYGNAMHGTLEWLQLVTKKNGKVPNVTQLAETLEQKLYAQRVDTRVYAQLLERGNNALQCYIQQRAATLLQPAYTEYSFKSEGVFIGEAHLNGTIDKLIIDETNKTIIIIDYKTGAAHTRWDNSQTLHGYKYQLYFYKILVERSRRFKNYRVVDAYLDFIEPDENGIVQALHVVFDEEQQDQLEFTIQAVWQAIVALDFPDVSNYQQNIKGIEQFESDVRSKYKTA
jgi:DNA helicase-2/ATP-dependent DNA helicase PcrA